MNLFFFFEQVAKRQIDRDALLRQLRAISPGLPVIITSAYISLEPQLQVLDIPHHGYLVKPFDLEALAERIDAIR